MMLNKLKYFFRNRNNDVYCSACGSCGETGCCPPTMCTNSKKGKYCRGNMSELRGSYVVLDEFREYLFNNHPTIYKVLEKIEDKHEL